MPIYNIYFKALRKTETMCFFKQLATPPAVPSDYVPPSKMIHEDTSADLSSDCGLQVLPDKRAESLQVGKCQSILMNCLGMISLNSQMMGVMDEVRIDLFRSSAGPRSCSIRAKKCWRRPMHAPMLLPNECPLSPRRLQKKMNKIYLKLPTS